ncbi:hypothetical protein APHAL10511_000507 [Amanita phalloides]|nr:hypothetical protein APHAL10511_000507 [Amanita phalloides]
MDGLVNFTNNAKNVTAMFASTPLPDELSSLVALMVSFSAIRDWLKFALVGVLLEACRRLSSIMYETLQDAIFITATFEDNDDCFDWMLHWLSNHPSWSKLRNVRISTRTFGLSGEGTKVPGEDQDAQLSTGNTRRLAYLPNISFSTVVWYKCHWMRVRLLEEIRGDSTDERLEIKILARGHQTLNQLLLEAKKSYIVAKEGSVGIYVSDSGNYWRHLADHHKRPLNSIILDPGVKNALLTDARDFLMNKAWYVTRGIPFRRGYLLYGAPGSGKTSIIQSLAGALGLDIYLISLSSGDLDDAGLTRLILDLPERCIAVMEDIDAALTHSITRESSDDADDDKTQNQRSAALGRVSLSGLLNALDGIGAQEGRILFATTNKYLSLDPALRRPGRMDVHIEFKLASKYQARELYKTFYMPDSKEDICESDSGYVSGAEKSSEEDDHAVDLIDFSEPSKDDDGKDGSISGVSITGTLHQNHAHRLSHQSINTLAEAFTDAIPERKVSMAALQGYLMMYKTQPLQAVKDVKSWVKKTEVTKNPVDK